MEKQDPKIVKLFKYNGKDVLLFNIKDRQHLIDLNNEEQTSLRNLFYDIISELFINDEIEFELIYDLNYEEKLFIEISEEYIKQLNTEIRSISKNILETVPL